MKDGRRISSVHNIQDLYLAQKCAHTSVDFLFTWSTFDLATFIQATELLQLQSHLSNNIFQFIISSHT